MRGTGHAFSSATRGLEVAQQTHQNDDGDRDSEYQKQYGTHWHPPQDNFLH
jgi:hypothetical protein